MLTITFANVPADKIAAVAKELAAKQKPKTYKAQLAREIVTLYHNAKAATAAEAEFNSVHRDKKDNNTVDNNLFGTKKRGYLNTTFAFQNDGKYITEW